MTGARVIFVLHGARSMPRHCTCPAWFKGVSTDLSATVQAHLLNTSNSEHDEPCGTKEGPVKTYVHASLETQRPSHDGQLDKCARFARPDFAVAPACGLAATLLSHAPS